MAFTFPKGSSFPESSGKAVFVMIRKSETSARIIDREFDRELTLSPRQERSLRRGCPTFEEFESLARTYLNEQIQLWPEAVAAGVLPAKITEEVVQKMASEAYDRFVANEIPELPPQLPKKLRDGLACLYNRYSDDNSNPRSLNQQMVLGLQAAKREGYFAPWELCFFDAAVSGTHPFRRGYQSVQSLLRENPLKVKLLVIDEISRANRNQIQTLLLMQTIKQSKVRMIGASDGFDSDSPNSQLVVSLLSTLAEQDSETKKARVVRGMRDAYKLGKPLSKPGFGYKLTPELNANGSLIINAKGKAVQQIVIVEKEAEQVRRIFKLFVEQGKSLRQIAEVLNAEKVGGKESWSAKTIDNILRRSMYVGKESWNTTSKVVKEWIVTSEAKPEEDWLKRDMPHLRIVDDVTWAKAQKRLDDIREAYAKNPRKRKVERSDVQPTRLFRLRCKACGQPLWLDRGGDRPVVRCMSGAKVGGRCRNKGGRSLVVVEESLLNFILEQTHRDEFLNQVAASGNAFIENFANQPPPDLAAMEQRLAKVQKTIKRALDLVTKVVDDADEDDSTVENLNHRIMELRDEERRLKAQLAANQQVRENPKPITVATLRLLMGKLREILLRSPEEAAPILYRLVGRVYLDQKEVSGYSRPQWSAEFKFDLADVCLEISRQGNCPSMRWWEFLYSHSWTFENQQNLPIRDIKIEERIAEKAGKMRDAGASSQAIAIALGVDSKTVSEALRLYGMGWKCYIPPRDLSYRRELPKSKTAELMPEVVRLRDVELWSFPRIAEHLNTTQDLVSRAYRQHHANATMESALTGQAPPQGRYVRLPKEKHDEINRLLMETTLSFREIERRTGVDKWTIRANRDRLLAEGKEVPIRPRENRAK